MLIFTVIDAHTFRRVGRYEYDAPKTWDEAQALLDELRRTKYPAKLYDLDDITIIEEGSASITAKKSIEDFAAVQTDGTHFCPRCGRFTVKDRLHTNALSRHIAVYICDACGTDEAVREFAGENLPLRDWAVARPGAVMRYDDTHKSMIRGEDCCPFWRPDEGGTCVGCPGEPRACISPDGAADCYLHGKEVE